MMKYRQTRITTPIRHRRRILVLWIMMACICLLVSVAPAGAGRPDGVPDDMPDDPTPVAIINFRVHKTISNGVDWEEMGRAVLGLNVGDKVTREKLAAAFARFDAFGKADIQVDVMPLAPEQGESGRGLALTVDLTPHRRIKSIRIEHGYPLFESDVRGIMTIAPGAFFDPKTIEAQAGLIARRYQVEGYIDPKVELAWDEDKDGHILLDVVIKKGPAFHAAKKEFIGNQAITDATLERRLAHRQWVGGGISSRRFSEEQLKKEVEFLTRYYRGKGYADVRITSHVVRNVQDKKVQIKFHIEEGPHYQVEFSGNHFFSKRVLKKDISLFETGNRGNVGLRRSIRNIRNRYLQAGFADIKVRRQDMAVTQQPRTNAMPEDQPGNTLSRREIKIEIDEGRRYVVERLDIKGNTHISDKTVKAQMLTRPPKGFKKGVYVARTLEEDLDAVFALYLQHGFLEARVSKEVSVNPDDKKVAVLVTIDEGEQTTVGDITFSGLLPLDEKTLRTALQLKPTQPFQPYLVENDQQLISARISAMGYPHVQTKGTVTPSGDKTRVHLNYDIAPGPLVHVGKIFFAGNFRTRHRILDHELGFNEGDVFSLDQIMKAQRNLRNLNLFESVQVHTIGLKEQAALAHLLFETPEKQPYSFELAGGYTTDKGFYGRSKWKDNNFAGTNKNIWVAGELAETGYRWDTGIGAPHLFGSRIRADLGVFGEHSEEFNQNFGTDSAGSTLNFKRQWARHITTSLGFQYEHRTQFPRNGSQDDIDNPDAYEERIFLVTTPYISYDTRDSFIRPTKGIFSNLSVDISSGLKGSLDNFLRYTFDLRGYTTPYDGLTLAAVGRAGYLTPMGADDVLPEDQLFFLGGTTDVRGYGENLFRYDDNGDPVGGRLALSSSFEARYDVGGDFELALFLDGGSLQVAPSEEGEGDWRWCAGLGLRYITPIGPIGLLYGLKLEPHPEEDPGRLHFSIGYTF